MCIRDSIEGRNVVSGEMSRPFSSRITEVPSPAVWHAAQASLVVNMAVIAGTCFGSAARRSPETEAHPGGPEGGKGAEASTTGTGAVTEGSEEHPAAQTVHQSAPKAHFLPKRPQPSRKTAATPPNLQTQAQPSHLPAPHATSPTLPSERSDDPRTNEPTRRAERSDEPRRAPSTRHQLAKRRLGGFRPRPRSSKEGRAERTSVREHARRRWTAGIGLSLIHI